MTGTHALRDELCAVETLVDALEQQAEPGARAAARQLVQTLLAFHRAGLTRLVEALNGCAGGTAALANAAEDDLLAGVLLLHGLHPLAPETRVRRALERVQPLLEMDGTTVSVVGVIGGVVRLRVEAADRVALPAIQRVLEEAIGEMAPDVTVVLVEDPTPWEGAGRIALPLVGAAAPGRP